MMQKTATNVNLNNQNGNPTKQRRIKKLDRYTTFDYVNVFLLLCFAFVCFYMLWCTLVGSLNDGNDYAKGGVYLWPRVFTFANYAVILSDTRIWSGLFVTVLRCVIGPVLLVLLTTTVAYGMARRESHFKKFFNTFFVITMFFSGGTIPYYILCKSLGMLNTFWMYVIPGMFNVYDMILIRSFLKGSPEELHEAAVIDGATEYRILFQIMIPTTMPILMTILMWGVLGHWNDYLTSELYLPKAKELHVLQYVLKKIINESGSSFSGDLPSVITQAVSQKTVSLAAMMFGTIPMIIVYPFLQKYFTKGLFVGSLKG